MKPADQADLKIEHSQADAIDPQTLSVVIPFFEEAPNALVMVQRVHEGLADLDRPWELICVDDGSADGTADILRQARAQFGHHVRVLQLRRNFGQTAAMQAGIDAARGVFIATLDGDLQNDPADIPRMIDELMERDLDLLQGWRRNRKDAGGRKLFSRVANWLIGKVTGVRLHDYGCSLKVYRAEVLKQIRLFGEMHRFIPIWMASVTSPARMGETVVSHAPRTHGQSKYGFSRTFRVLVDLLSVFFFLRFRARPGHFFGLIGLVFGFVGGAILLYLMVLKFGWGLSIGNRPLFVAGIIMAIFSAQFLTTGVLAELLARVFFESSHRANYSLLQEPADSSQTWHQAPTSAD
jgi:glycosyltransferase involved in cell wall biosynthesis